MVHYFSSLVTSGVPSLFYTDFKGENFHAFAIEDLPANDIEFAFHAPKERSNHPHKPDFIPTNPIIYKDKFETIQEHIRSGNTYLINLTQPTSIFTHYTLKEIYTMADAPYKLRVKNDFVCFSPEPFITIEGDNIHTFPMKGTIDASLNNAIETILGNPKELAEHTMIVDLLRNDLGMVANDIKVEKFRYITTINAGQKHLHQVSSHISGKLQTGWEKNIGELICRLLPAGSISGTPKQKTVHIIEQVEGYHRGYFTGVFGYYDGNNLYSAVAIRFIENDHGKFIYKSGGGITAESICEHEYSEMIDKVYIP